MQSSRRDFLKMMGVAGGAASLTIAGSLPAWGAAGETLLAISNPTLHLLNRLTYGARPQDLERAKAIGAAAFLGEQLNPASIDDSVLEAKLAELPILNMDRRTAYRLVEREYRCYISLTKGMILRGVYGERQLQERLTEFWTDHFNIPSDELGPELVTFQRDIRANALGNFRDLLFATAQSPAMLHYLDNYLNVAEHPNENYARELMELHTLGVDGGYTEADVKAVARAFTGWTVHEGADDGFFFDVEVHDLDEKTILGHNLPANRGIEDGLHVLSILANHAATARFVCRKLCVRFVSDNPPDALVEGAAAVWITNRGDIKEVLRHIFQSEAFQASAGQKLRRPLDFFIGALRATGTEIHEFYTMELMLQELAQVPFGWHPPDGYPDSARAWMNSSGLLARWNTAMSLTHSAYSDYEQQKVMTSHLRERTGDFDTVGNLVDSVAYQVFAGRLPENMRTTFIAYVTEDGDAATAVTSQMIASKLGSLYGLMLTSPLYQWI
jgi:uncharacterized protein (DUF1800 family)